MTLLLLLAPIGFAFLLLLSMGRYERWALTSDSGRAEATAATGSGTPETAGSLGSDALS